MQIINQQTLIATVTQIKKKDTCYNQDIYNRISESVTKTLKQKTTPGAYLETKLAVLIC